MMNSKYYRLSVDMDDPEAMTATRAGNRSGELERSSHPIGVRIRKAPKVSFVMAGTKATDCPMWPLFSSRLKSLVEDAGLTGCEFHPVKVSHVDGTRTDRYWLTNVLKIKGAFDFTRALYTYTRRIRGKRLLSVIRPALLGPKTKSRDFLRLAEDLPGVFVSARFVTLYTKNRCSGLRFKEVPVAWPSRATSSGSTKKRAPSRSSSLLARDEDARRDSDVPTMPRRSRRTLRDVKRIRAIGRSFHLPADLAQFLAAGSQLAYDARSCECGYVKLRGLDALRWSTIAVTAENTRYKRRDPHRGEDGAYLVRVIDLLAECEGYSPLGILLWIPRKRVFGAWDSDHWPLIVFKRATWSDIVAHPLRYLNAQWWLKSKGSGCTGVHAAPWEYGVWKAGEPGDVWPPR